mmetsp:Transcript_197/g.589  ORF Transcript_197/g.589 Transcript_197/m.589 type:complete len:308 (-) Transcript_197:53-976(-)
MQTTSCAATRPCRRFTVAASTSGDWCGCPGMGISISSASALASGMTARTASQAACAFGRPSAASWCVKRLWRTGFDRETRPESTKVMRRTPQPMRARARWQPRVPAPRSRKRRLCILSGSSSGSRRHFMSFTLRSTASAAMRRLSMKAVRSKFWIFVQPANCASAGGGDASAVAAGSAAASMKKTRERTGASAPRAARPGSRKARKRRRPGRCRASARMRFRSGHPGAPSAGEGSTKSTAGSSSSEAAAGRPFRAPRARSSHGPPAAPRTSRQAPARARAASSRSRCEASQSSSRLKPASSAPQDAL